MPSRFAVPPKRHNEKKSAGVEERLLGYSFLWNTSTRIEWQLVQGVEFMRAWARPTGHGRGPDVYIEE